MDKQYTSSVYEDTVFVGCFEIVERVKGWKEGVKKMKKAKKHIIYYCPDCDGHVDENGITYCLCEGGFWEDAKWIKEKRKRWKNYD